MVHTINYNSETRDTVIQFPEGDHNQYKKILMHYSMRCKDGLVSPNIPGQTNIGCGEWDYSCNTNIVDSTQVDSLKQVSPDHVISGWSGDIYEYTTQETYVTHRRTNYNVDYVSGGSVSGVTIGEGNMINSFGLFTNKAKKKVLMILSAEQMNDVGLVSGNIERMIFNALDGNADVRDLEVNMMLTSNSEPKPDMWHDSGWTQVYRDSHLFGTSKSTIDFHTPFAWNGSSHIAVSVNFENVSGGTARFSGNNDSDNTILTADGKDDMYLKNGASGRLISENSYPEISDEITIMFWAKGDPNLPINTTILEGVDQANRRQVNVHLPWNNGQVYWDCGNNGDGYDRINKSAPESAYKNEWTHWAFTKNAVTGEMKIYLNGIEWHSGTGLHRSIDLQRFVLGASSSDNPLYYYGKMDDFSIWSKALTADEIADAAYAQITADHPQYSSLISYYTFDNDDIIVQDHSPAQKDLMMEGNIIYDDWESEDLVKNVSSGFAIPEIQFQNGDFVFDITEEIVDRQESNLPNRVDQYILDGTDRILENTYYYYTAGDQPIYDQDYNEVGTVNFAAENSIEIEMMDHYSKSPMVYELMSFVTPYGINLDLGIEGKTWTFDVTELGPILKGSKRIFLNRGGQLQEDMDIRFEFIEGTPVRDVISIRQIWPVTQTAYGQILDDHRFEPRNLTLHEETDAAVFKSVITGHGQQGEFIPRVHFLSANGIPNPWEVWTECADNPIYPQGGTWVYDRAGWCPGAPSDVEIWDATEFLDKDEANEIDYSITGATGESRYIVNVQLVEYGTPNYANDVELLDIQNPSTKVIYERYNPACQEPVITVRNNGTEDITSLSIRYGYEDDMSTAKTYEWSGTLEFLETMDITLPHFPGLTVQGGDSRFKVEIDHLDEDMANNELTSVIQDVDHHEDEVIIQIRTNSRPQESSYNVRDEDGNIILSRSGSSMNANTTYSDTLRNMAGCYRLTVLDSDGDGLSWWANNDGSGFVRVKSGDDSWNLLPQDFGSIYRYQFTAGDPVSTLDIPVDELIKIYPNPTDRGIYLELDEHVQHGVLQVIDELGRQVHTQRLRNEGSVYIDAIQDMSPGIYHISINTDYGVFTQRLVKI